ncbi:MAG: hypothetical protein ACK5N0_04190 [Synechococcaceae cyanobacterium]
MVLSAENGGVLQGCRILQLTRHAADKLVAYGITDARLESWRSAFAAAEPFLDVSTGARGLVIHWEKRPGS